MTDTLRTRIAAAIERSLVAQFPPDLPDRYGEWIDNGVLADALIRELPELTALRRCGRCRIPCLPHEYPPMSEGSNELRPFCIPCTEYIEWATS